MSQVDLKAGQVVNLKKISEFAEQTTVSATDILPISDASGRVKKITVEDILSPVSGGVGNATNSSAPIPGVNTYNVIGLSGNYSNFLVSAGTSASFTTEELESALWQLVLPQGATYWIRKEVPGVDISGKVDLVDFIPVEDKVDSIQNSLDGIGTFSDEDGNIIMRITEQGLESAGIKSDMFNVSDAVIKSTPDYAFAITDEAGFMCYYVDYDGRVFTLQNNDPLKNKKISILGDSISTGASGGTTTSTVYWGLMKTWHNLDVFVNAISGSQVGRNDTVNRFMNPDRWGSLNSLFTPDIILIFGGTNDFGSSLYTVLGTLSDPDDGSSVTFYGALKYLLKSITDANRTTRVFYMTPLMRADKGFPAVNTTSSLLFTSYITAIREVCFMYNVTLIDTFQESIFTYANMNQTGLYSTDKLHPNPAGHLKLAEYLSNKLSQFFKP